MEPERWQLIEQLCQTVWEMEPEIRAAYLKEACVGDESLRKEVETLLANRPIVESFMKEPAMGAAAKALAKEQEDAPAQDLIGRTIAHYCIVGKIGQGGMGEVFLAEDRSLNRKVALKLLPREMQRDAVARKRLLREAHSAAALDHPYICSIHEVAESEGKDFIVMEYVDGQTLKDRLAQGPLPLKEAAQIANEVAEALEEAHEKSIIHRDLKPANIMLTRKGHAKVMDFGLAKQLNPPEAIEGEDESVTALTRTGMTLGTLAYMSPEQLRGKTIDARSDIFSFGVVLYEMLAGVHPFKKETGMDTASAILNDAPQPLGELRPDIPALLQHIVKKMLAKDPRRRYLSIYEAQADLRELLEESGRPAVPKRGRLQSLYWITATALAVVGVGIWASFRFSPREAALLPTRIAPVTTYLYWQKTKTEQIDFVTKQGNRIAGMLGSNSSSIGSDGLRLIKQELDKYVVRRESLSADLGKEGLRPLYARASLHAPLIIQSFAKTGVPPAIGLYIPLVETEYRPCIEGLSDTKGLFQFWPQTARQYGLMPGDVCDAKKEASAAALFMADRIAEFGSDSASVTLTILSFSLGADNVRGYLRKLLRSGNNERSFWACSANAEKLDERFRNQGLRYVPRFFAAAIMGENPSVFDLQIKPLSSYVDIAK